VVVLERPRLLLGEDDHLTCSLCESLEHGLGSFLPTSARLALGRSGGLGGGWEGLCDGNGGETKIPRPSSRYSARMPKRMNARGTSFRPYPILPTGLAVHGRYFRAGNRTTSRIEGRSVSNITRRSMPMPMPPVGGMPCSSAR